MRTAVFYRRLMLDMECAAARLQQQSWRAMVKGGEEWQRSWLAALATGNWNRRRPRARYHASADAIAMKRPWPAQACV